MHALVRKARALVEPYFQKALASGELHYPYRNFVHFYDYPREGVLHFVSNAYYFEFGRMRIRLPAWLPPGTTHVEHIDLGNG